MKALAVVGGWLVLAAAFVAVVWRAKRKAPVKPCRHVWRQNVAWSHLQRCDGCGSDRPRPVPGSEE